MTIRELNDSEKVEYEKIAESYGTIFNTLQWLSIFKGVSIYGIFNKNNKLIGGFSLFKDKRWGFSIYRNPPFTPMIGPFFSIDSKNLVNIIAKRRRILDSMSKFLSSINYSIISISLNREIFDTLPFMWHKFKVIPGYTYVLNLDQPIDKIIQGMSVNRRNDINKGIRDGLTVKSVHDFEMIKSLVLKTFYRQNKYIDTRYIDKVLFEFSNENNSFAFVTFCNSRPVSAVFCIHDGKTAYYLLGGYDDKYRHHGAGALAMLNAIRHSKDIGLKYFDFEGSIVPQIERYFRGFGGQLIPYFRINKAWFPIEVLLKFRKRELF